MNHHRSGSSTLDKKLTKYIFFYRLQCQCCGSWMFIPDPISRILIFTHPGSKNGSKREGWKKISCHTLFCSHKFHKIKNLGQFSKNYRTSYPKNCLSKIWVWDPRSGIRKKYIPDPGSRGQRGTGSRIRILNTLPHFPLRSGSLQFCFRNCILMSSQVLLIVLC
jgi:hypothetical protein